MSWWCNNIVLLKSSGCINVSWLFVLYDQTAWNKIWRLMITILAFYNPCFPMTTLYYQVMPCYCISTWLALKAPRFPTGSHLPFDYCLIAKVHSRSLQWRHNGRDGVSNYQPHDCLLNRLFRRKSKKSSKFRVTGLCLGKSPGTGEFPAQTRKMFPFDNVIMLLLVNRNLKEICLILP